MLGGMAATIAIAGRGSDKPVRLVVVDETASAFEPLVAALDERFEDGRRKFELEQASLNSLVEVDEVIERLRLNVLARDLDGYLYLREDFLATGRARYSALSVSNFDLNQRIQRALSGYVRQNIIADSGLDRAQSARLLGGARLDTFKITEEGESEDRGQTFGMVYALAMMLYMGVILYGSMISRAIVEEKVSRVVEVMLASVRPFQLLTGKVIGLGCVGLTQMLVWCSVAFVVLNFRSKLAEIFDVPALAEIPLPEFPPGLLAHFLIWFLLGYFLFALLYALVASISGSEQESQQLQFPMIILLVIPLVSMVGIIQNPDSGFAVTMSLIPFFAPMVMLMRTAVLTPPWYQIAASMALCAATSVVLLWLVAKIYRIGILSYGKRPSLRELARWLVSS